MDFAKATSLRPDNNEMEIMQGYLCLSPPEPLLQWIASTAIPEQEHIQYQETAKRTRNGKSSPESIALGKNPSSIAPSTPKLPISNSETISIQPNTISYLTLESHLTLNEHRESVCKTRMVLFIRVDGGDGKNSETNATATNVIPPHPEDEDPNVASLGGARMPALWFERDLHNLASTSGLSAKYPTAQDVEKELKYWFNSIGFDLEQSKPMPSVYHIGPFANDSLIANRPPSRNGLLSIASNVGMLGLNVVSGIVGQPITASITNKIEDATFEVLNTFSHITRITKNTGTQVLEHPLTRPILPLIPTSIRDIFMSNEEAARLLNEYEGAGEYLKLLAEGVGGKIRGRATRPKPSQQTGSPSSQPKRITIKDVSRDLEVLNELLSPNDRAPKRTYNPITAEEWVSFYNTETGKLSQSQTQLYVLIFMRGVEHDIRPDVWKYLLDFYPWDSTDAERKEILSLKDQEYEAFKSNWKTILADTSATDGPTHGLGNGLGGDEREDGDVVDKLKERRYRVEKDVVRTDRNVPFFSMEEGAEISSPISPTALATKLPRNIEMLRDVLVTYTVFNFEIGYVQGMNDLLAPILAVMQSEVESFWSFAHYMDTMKVNFYRDQSGMRTQLKSLELLIRFMDPYLYHHLDATDSINLFCCFRWMLVRFKREFNFDQILRLWEVMWSCPLTNHMHIFIAFAILNEHRQNIFQKCAAFDETLKYINDLCCKMDVETILYRAESLFQVFRLKIREVATVRLGVDVATGVSVGDSQNTPLKKETVADGTDPNFTTDSTKMVDSNGHKLWGCAMDEFGLDMMSDEEIWELLALLEKKEL